MKNLIQKLNSKKGFTLVELCIAMGLIAVVAAMVISFSTLAQDQTKSSVETSNFQNDFVMIDTSISAWLACFDNANYTIYATKYIDNENDGEDLTYQCLRAYNSATKKNYRFYLKGKKVVWETPNNEDGALEPNETSVELENVTNISFKIESRRDNANKYYGPVLITLHTEYEISKYKKTVYGERDIIKTARIATKRDFTPEKASDNQQE